MPPLLTAPVQLDVPQEWADQLAVLSPPVSRERISAARLRPGAQRTVVHHNYLKLIWEQGYPWEPVERYMIYEMIPADRLISEFELNILDQLENPRPPSEMGNYYDQHLNGGRGGFVRNPDCLITERAWHLFQQTMCWGKPFWVIQGTLGGHKRWFSPIEKKILRIQGLPTEPPAPGDLPYAPFDNRVLEQLSKHDLLKGRHDGLVRQKAILKGTRSSHLMAEEKDLRKRLVEYLTQQVTEFAPDVHKALMKLDAPRQRGGKDQLLMEQASERAVQNYIETGNSHRGANPRRIT